MAKLIKVVLTEKKKKKKVSFQESEAGVMSGSSLSGFVTGPKRRL